jgi:hypothetical protein
MLPSPAAAATRLAESARASPTAKTPGRLVSNRYGLLEAARQLSSSSAAGGRFVRETAERTRVELEHRHIDRHGDGWEQMRDAVGSPEGWSVGLGRFAARFGTSALVEGS